jgi:hypothetical protein
MGCDVSFDARLLRGLWASLCFLFVGGIVVDERAQKFTSLSAAGKQKFAEKKREKGNFVELAMPLLSNLRCCGSTLTRAHPITLFTCAHIFCVLVNHEEIVIQHVYLSIFG